MNDLLTETNTTWKLFTLFYHPKIPGMNIETWRIPPAYQGYVGYELDFYLGNQQDAYYLCYRKAGKNEKLIMAVNAKNLLLLVLDVEIGGVNKLYELIQNDGYIHSKDI